MPISTPIDSSPANNKKNILVLYYSEDLFMPTVAKSLKENFENYGGKTNLIGYSIDLKSSPSFEIFFAPFDRDSKYIS